MASSSSAVDVPKLDTALRKIVKNAGLKHGASVITVQYFDIDLAIDPNSERRRLKHSATKHKVAIYQEIHDQQITLVYEGMCLLHSGQDQFFRFKPFLVAEKDRPFKLEFQIDDELLCTFQTCCMHKCCQPQNALMGKFRIQASMNASSCAKCAVHSDLIARITASAQSAELGYALAEMTREIVQDVSDRYSRFADSFNAQFNANEYQKSKQAEELAKQLLKTVTNASTFTDQVQTLKTAVGNMKALTKVEAFLISLQQKGVFDTFGSESSRLLESNDGSTTLSLNAFMARVASQTESDSEFHARREQYIDEWKKSKAEALSAEKIEAVAQNIRQNWVRGENVADTMLNKMGVNDDALLQPLRQLILQRQKVNESSDHEVDICPVCKLDVDNCGWFAELKEFFNQYLVGLRTDDELQEFVSSRDLQQHADKIRGHFAKWAKTAEETLPAAFRYKMPKAVVFADVERSSTVMMSALLFDKSFHKLHKEQLIAMEKAAIDELPAVEGEIMCPWLTYGNVVAAPAPDDAVKKVPVELLFNNNELQKRHGGHQVVQLKLEEMFRGPAKIEICPDNLIRVKVNFIVETDESEIEEIPLMLNRFAQLNVRCVKIGQFDIEDFNYPLREECNKIYSENATEKADGFTPTWWSGSVNHGGEPYFCPTGWRKFAVDVSVKPENFESDFGEWVVLYHGTAKKCLMSILVNGLRACNNGTGCNCYLEDDEGGIYVSPSIEYCGHPRYAKDWTFKAENGANRNAQMVLQVRLDVRDPCMIVTKNPETLLDSENKNIKIDPNFSNDQLEWIVKRPPGKCLKREHGLLVYGIMLRVSSSSLKLLSQNKWWSKVWKN